MIETFKQAWPKAFEREEYPSEGKFYISEAGFDPRYRLARARGQFKQFFDTSMRKKMEEGKWIEDRYLKALKQILPENTTLDQQIKFKFYGGNAYADAVLTTPEKKILLEIKSTSAKTTVPIDYNIYQVQGYMLAAEQNKIPVDEAWLIYINRDDAEVRPLRLEHNKEMQAEIDMVHRKLKEAYESHTDLKDFPDDAYWGVDLKKYHTPRAFAIWFLENYGFDKGFYCQEVMKDEEIRAEQDAKIYLEMVKKGLNDKDLKPYAEKVKEWFELGYTDFATSLGTIKGSKQRREGINVKDVTKCGLCIPAELESHVKRSESWTLYKKLNK